MIKGHGDDAYQYAHIDVDFSSNICAAAGHQALTAHLLMRPDLIAHYPEPEAWSLERSIAEYAGIDPSQVIATNGATEAIYLVAQAFPLRPVIPRPTFSEYDDACAMFPRVDNGRSMVWLCNPNNPTGDVYDPSAVEQLMARHDLVVVDQSYEDYTDRFVMPPQWAVRQQNVVQIHSFTKSFAIPGLRLGYITASAALAEHLRGYLRPWSVSALAVEAGKFLIEHPELRCRPDLNEALRLRDHLQQIDGVLTQPTYTNFMLCQFEADIAASELKDYLARHHRMLIRDAANFRGLTRRHFRVAAQRPEENDALVAAIREFMKVMSDK